LYALRQYYYSTVPLGHRSTVRYLGLIQLGSESMLRSQCARAQPGRGEGGVAPRSMAEVRSDLTNGCVEESL